MSAKERPPGEHPPMTAEVMTVTPEMAGDWLARNTHNRPINEDRVVQYALEMEAGSWVLNGTTVSFNTRGTLIDGQHRLLACVMSNTPFQTLVVHNAPLEAFETIDAGLKRTLAHALALVGEVNCTALAGVIAMTWRYSTKRMTGKHIAPPTHDALVFLRDRPDLREATKVACRLVNHCPIPPSVAGTAWYLFSRVDPEHADIFMTTLGEGAGLEKTNPIFQLRERLIANRASRLKIGTTELLALTIKAWNYWRVGKEVQLLLWRHRSGEEFPEVAS